MSFATIRWWRILLSKSIKVLDKIKRAAKEQQLPISVATTTPELEDSFWCCVIGKGYPVPNNSFRFCTEK